MQLSRSLICQHHLATHGRTIHPGTKSPLQQHFSLRGCRRHQDDPSICSAEKESLRTRPQIAPAPFQRGTIRLGRALSELVSGPLSIVLWLGLVLIGIASMQWGAARAADLLDILRGHWGLPATAGGALMRLATTSPEIAVNVTSVVFGWPDLGLGTALGSRGNA